MSDWYSDVEYAAVVQRGEAAERELRVRTEQRDEWMARALAAEQKAVIWEARHVAMTERAEAAERERDELREAIEGKWAKYGPDGFIVEPGWMLIDGGRYDELEAAERELADALADGFGWKPRAEDAERERDQLGRECTRLSELLDGYDHRAEAAEQEHEEAYNKGWGDAMRCMTEFMQKLALEGDAK